MKLRTFTAPDMPSALKQIREALGPDAVILGSQKESGKQSIRVTAAIDADSEKTAFEDFKDTIELAKRQSQQREWMYQLRELLTFHRVPDSVISRMKRLAEKTDLSALLTLRKLTGESSKPIVEAQTLATVLKHCFSFSPVHMSEPGKRICFIGPVGAGKTVATAKCATLLALKKQPVSVITLDNERAGGVEQLSKYTDILNLELHIAETKTELLRIIKSIPLSHTTFIDTPGCNPNDQHAVDELMHMVDAAGIEPVLVLPAGLDSEESMETAHSFNHPQLKRLLVTRMDAARRIGNILAAAAESGLAFSHFSDSPQVVDSCKILDETHLAAFLLKHTQLKHAKPRHMQSNQLTSHHEERVHEYR